MVESVKLESKLTSGFPAMTATAQVHKRSPRDGLLKWIVKVITVAALIGSTLVGGRIVR